MRSAFVIAAVLALSAAAQEPGGKAPVAPPVSTPQKATAGEATPAAAPATGVVNPSSGDGLPSPAEAPPATAPAAESPAPPVDRATVDALNAKVEALERRLAQEETSRTEGVSLVQRSLDTLKSTPAMLSKLGIGFTLTGFIQSDVQWHQDSQEQLDPATHQPLNDTRFLIRRARLRPELSYGPISGLIEADFNTLQGAQARIVGAEVSAAYAPVGSAGPLVQGTLGQFKIPFGFEVPQSDRERLFMERSTIMRALFPGEYDLGLRAAGQWRFFRYALAWMNGHPIGERQLPDQAPVAPRDVVGRVGIDAEPVSRVRVEAGFSGLVGTGFHPGTAATKDQIVWRDTNGDNLAQASELQIIPGQPAQPSAAFAHQAVGGDVRVTLDLLPLGRTELLGELVWAKNLDRALVPSDPIALGRDLRALGWYAALTQQLTRYAAVGVRYDRYNPDLDALDSRAGQVLPRDLSFSTLAVTAAFVYRPVLRVIAEYDHNTNALGRDATGAPANLASDAFIMRGEVSF
jgi:hypothetical protein